MSSVEISELKLGMGVVCLQEFPRGPQTGYKQNANFGFGAVVFFVILQKYEKG